MKRILFLLIALCALQVAAKKAPKIILLSDTHVMAPSLVVADGKAIEKYAASDMRMIRFSAEIFSTAIDKAIAAKPDMVLITGDISKDGERQSHEWVAKQLYRLKKAGIKALVIPGNHDISNANATFFNGDKKSDAPTITREEFAQIYSDFGYGAGSLRDPASLSYATEAVPGLVIIGIDSNRDEENLLKQRGDSVNTYHTAGRVKDEALEWVCQQAKKARDEGKQVIAMMHHHLIEHFDSEARFLNKYVVADNENLRNALINAGIHTILTGHLHVADIARDYNNGDSITEVASGSLITYPFYYRTLTLKGDKMTVETAQIKSVASNHNLLAEGKTHITQAVPGLLDGLLNKALGKMDKFLDQMKGMIAMLGGGGDIDLKEQKGAMRELCHQQFDEIATKAYVAILEGNEGQNPDSKVVIDGLEEGIKRTLDFSFPGGMGSMIQSFMKENAMPQFDNILRSMMEDRNHCGTPQEVVVDDMKAQFRN